MSEDIEGRVNSIRDGMRDLTQLDKDESSVIKMIVAGTTDIAHLNNLGVSIGKTIQSLGDNSYVIGDMIVQISKELSLRIIV